jgi:hypothetical protein
MNPFACLATLSIGSGLDLLVDPVDQPSSIGDWELVIVTPIHSKVVAKEKERLKHYLWLVFRREVCASGFIS